MCFPKFSTSLQVWTFYMAGFDAIYKREYPPKVHTVRSKSFFHPLSNATRSADYRSVTLWAGWFPVRLSGGCVPGGNDGRSQSVAVLARISRMGATGGMPADQSKSLYIKFACLHTVPTLSSDKIELLGRRP